MTCNYTTSILYNYAFIYIFNNTNIPEKRSYSRRKHFAHRINKHTIKCSNYQLIEHGIHLLNIQTANAQKMHRVHLHRAFQPPLIHSNIHMTHSV